MEIAHSNMNNFLKHLDFVTVMGFVAGLLTSISMLPQVIKTLKEKKAEDVSIVMLLILISGIALWIWYGIKKSDFPILLTNCISMVINLIMIWLRFKYKNKQ